jgi:predicted amidohydrolase YtcJ
LQAGVTSAFASDWPVVPLDALGTLHAAVHRRVVPFSSIGGAGSSGGSISNNDGSSGGGSSGGGSSSTRDVAGSSGGSPEAGQGESSAAAGDLGPEAVSYWEALRAVTAEGARAAFWEQDVGMIK